MKIRLWLFLSLTVVAAAAGGWFAWGPTQGPSPIIAARSEVEGPKVRLHRETSAASFNGPARALSPSDFPARTKSREAIQPAPVTQGLDESAVDSTSDAGSLLAAFRSSGDVAWLKAALERFPNDPAVLAEVALHGGSNEQKDQAIAQLQTVEPSNIVPLHLGAAQAIAQGRHEDGLRQLNEANRLMHEGGEFDDHRDDFADQSMAAYLAAGYTREQAETLRTMNSRRNLAPHYELLARQINYWARRHQALGNLRQAKAFRELGRKTFEWVAVAKRFREIADFREERTQAPGKYLKPVEPLNLKPPEFPVRFSRDQGGLRYAPPEERSPPPTEAYSRSSSSSSSSSSSGSSNHNRGDWGSAIEVLTDPQPADPVDPDSSQGRDLKTSD